MQTATIEKLIPGGQALATLPSGKKALLWGALPGETVEFEITKEKSTYLEGTATRILEKSERRVNPRDPCYLSTSPWQILDFPYEQEQKSLLVLESFRQAGLDHPNLIPLPITDNNDYFYRNKMEYALYWNNETNQINLALHKRGTHGKIPITQSSIERPEILQRAQEIIADLNNKKAQARTYQSLLIRCNQQGQTSSALFENKKPHPKMHPLTDTLLGKEYTYSGNGFFQINLPLYERALQEIKKHIQTEKVLDLYAGVGTIGLSVAPDHQLTLVEVNAAAYQELLTNCQKTPKAKPILAKSEEVLDFITPDTTAILDPPRAGCHPSLIERLAQVQPPQIIYLSCNPPTQARDLKPLLEAGYTLEKIQPYNFFPHTPHIENLAILSKK